MFAQQAQIPRIDSPDTLLPGRGPDLAAVVVEEPDDQMVPARGFALGLLLGAGSLAILGGVLWWAI